MPEELFIEFNTAVQSAVCSSNSAWCESATKEEQTRKDSELYRKKTKTLVPTCPWFRICKNSASGIEQATSLQKQLTSVQFLSTGRHGDEHFRSSHADIHRVSVVLYQSIYIYELILLKGEPAYIYYKSINLSHNLKHSVKNCKYWHIAVVRWYNISNYLFF